MGLLRKLEILRACRLDRDSVGWHSVGQWAFPSAACPACELRRALRAKGGGSRDAERPDQ